MPYTYFYSTNRQLIPEGSTVQKLHLGWLCWTLYHFQQLSVKFSASRFWCIFSLLSRLFANTECINIQSVGKLQKWQSHMFSAMEFLSWLSLSNPPLLQPSNPPTLHPSPPTTHLSPSLLLPPTLHPSPSIQLSLSLPFPPSPSDSLSSPPSPL